MGKARLAPIKSITIPRLELTAATLSVRVSSMLADELDEPLESHVYWTDSTTVLKYLNNEKARFKVFVANRVQTIRDMSKPEQWHYVDSPSNPADDASRGLSVSSYLERKRWINAPEFLWKPANQWPRCPDDVKQSNLDDPEIKRITTCVSTYEQDCGMLNRFKYFSSWYRLIKAMAWILRIKPTQQRIDKPEIARSSECRPIMVEEMEKAEIVILKILQEDCFAAEIRTLEAIQRDNASQDERNLVRKRKLMIKRKSSLYRLDPYLDTKGLLRVGGRLSRLEEACVHPVILPRKGHITELIIRHAHEKVAYSGRGITLNEIRNKFWIINGNSAVRWFISRCVTCRRLRAPKAEQKMADLPKDRVTPAPPFSFCAVDYFGPITIKEGRKELKRYGVLFTCLASRAIHLESANSLETDSFLNALRRFIARRGPIREMRSDQGTNLVGAAKELKEALKEIDHDKIREYLLHHCHADWLIKWTFNPPAASHMDGSWER